MGEVELRRSLSPPAVDFAHPSFRLWSPCTAGPRAGEAADAITILGSSFRLAGLGPVDGVVRVRANMFARLGVGWWRMTRLRVQALPVDAITATCHELAKRLAVRPPGPAQSLISRVLAWLGFVARSCCFRKLI